MPKESHLELKVGLFVLAAMIGLAMFIFSVTDTSVLEEGKTLKVVFGFANGLKKSAPVRIAGVDQGSVKAINLFFDRKDKHTKVVIDLWLKKAVQIPSDSVIMINQLGLMGEKYIEIIPGMDTENFFKEGQTLIGKDPIAQEMLSEKVWGVAEKVEQTVTGVNKVITDDATLDSLKLTLVNLSTMTGALNSIIYDLKDGKGTAGKLLYDERLYDNLEGMTADLQGMAADLKTSPWKLLYRPKEKRR